MANPPVTTRRCDGVTRRDMLRIGGLTAFGLGLPDFFKLRGRAADAPDGAVATARSCILIWLDGGPSHLETFDLKPDAPKEVRGALNPISTRVPGIHICEYMPRTAEVMDRVAVIRSITSPLGEHNFGTHYMMTGYKPTPVVEYPSIGSVVAHVRGNHGVLPSHVAVPNFGVGGSKLTGNGFLPSACRPFSVSKDRRADVGKPGFRVPDLDFYSGIDLERIDRRREFLSALDRFGRGLDESQDAPSDPEFEQAYRLITSPEAKKAFDLTEESPAVRKRFGSKAIGQSCLMARRLIERGVPFVTVNNVGWDTHNDLFTRLIEGYTGAIQSGKEPVGLIPSLDRAFAALIDDLQQRGMLDETLIVVMGEFGRTPKLNTAGGRDHWPRVFSVALAGGGIQGGQVVGSSDSVGESPHDRPVTPSDLACTIYHQLGIEADYKMFTPDGRPVEANQGGQVVSELV